MFTKSKLKKMVREDIYVGQHVHYTPANGKKENGRVKAITEHGVYVVYRCGDNWDDFQEYTGANTPIEDLHPGWINEKDELIQC